MTAHADPVAGIFERVRAHDFHPVRDGFTFDRHLDTHGVARLDDLDWRVRTLAVRDLVRAGLEAAPRIAEGLVDEDRQVRYLAAVALGILRAEEAIPALEAALRADADSTVRSQAAVALRLIGAEESLPALKSARDDDASRDVRHQGELAVHGIESGFAASSELAEAFASLDESAFGQVSEGAPDPDFDWMVSPLARFDFDETSQAAGPSKLSRRTAATLQARGPTMQPCGHLASNWPYDATIPIASGRPFTCFGSVTWRIRKSCCAILRTRMARGR